jgi:prophage regulatory protein
MVTKILRLPDVLQRCGLSRSSLYALMAENQFPKSVKISMRSVGWVESDLDDWVQARIKDAERVRSHKISANEHQNSFDQKHLSSRNI